MRIQCSWKIKDIKLRSECNNFLVIYKDDFLVLNNSKLSFPSFPPKRMFSTKESIIIERKNCFEEIFFFIISSKKLVIQLLIDVFKDSHFSNISFILVVLLVSTPCKSTEIKFLQSTKLFIHDSVFEKKSLQRN